jgi:hypothetical protein
MQPGDLSHVITLRANGIANALHIPIGITIHDEDIPLTGKTVHKTRGLFDTGASATVITQKVVDAFWL